MIYLDHITASPIDPRVLEAMQPYMDEHFGSPVSLHRGGAQARQALDKAREQIAGLIRCEQKEIIFTSGGTESDNLAIKGLAQAYMGKGRHVVVSAIESHAVLYAARTLERHGFTVTQIPVDANGIVHPEAVRQAMQEDTILVSVVLASDEIGVIQPVRDITDIAHEHGAVMHTDAVCAGGHVPVNVQTLGVDALSLSARSMHGPPGCGALFLKQGTRIRPQIEGGIQEAGRRGGHENIPAIVGFGRAAELAQVQLPDQMIKLRQLDQQLLRGLATRIPGLSLNGHTSKRLPGHLNLMIRDADSESMVLMLDTRGIAVSIGSSCASHAFKPSHVLLAIGRSPREAQSSLLITMGASTTEMEIEQVKDVFPDIVEQLRDVAGVAV